MKNVNLRSKMQRKRRRNQNKKIRRKNNQRKLNLKKKKKQILNKLKKGKQGNTEVCTVTQVLNLLKNDKKNSNGLRKDFKKEYTD